MLEVTGQRNLHPSDKLPWRITPQLAAKAASIACRMLAVSNLKFLKLLPGPLSDFCGSDPSLSGALSEGIPPSALFLAFQTEVPAKA